VKLINEQLRAELSISLFGFDIVIEDDTNDYYLIDLNYLPGYNISDLSQL